MLWGEEAAAFHGEHVQLALERGEGEYVMLVGDRDYYCPLGWVPTVPVVIERVQMVDAPAPTPAIDPAAPPAPPPTPEPRP